MSKLTDTPAIATTNGDVAQSDATSAELPDSLQANGSQSTASLQDEGEPPVQSEARAELEDYRPPTDSSQQPAAVTAARRRFFNRIITNCVLQLLMIETVHELFSNDNVYTQIPSHELLRLMGLLKKSYQFAKKFNEDKDLRMQLWRQGFMKQPPNLLKQESGSAATYVHILFRMYHDEREERQSSRAETEAALIPYVSDFLHRKQPFC
jgi:brefeldin A-inhibited guanine nucleotide-exchange protein